MSTNTDAPASPVGSVAREARIDKVEGGIKSGNRVHIKGGEVDGVDLSGFTGHVIRDEQVRDNGASGKREPMVMVQVDTGTGTMSSPIDMPRRLIKGPKDGVRRAFSAWVGRLGRKTVGVIRDGKYVDLTKTAS